MSYKVGDEVRIKRTDGSTSIARIKETSVRYVKAGTSTVTSKKLDESAIGTKVKDKENNVYIASKVYTVVILDKDNDFAETTLRKTIIGSDILGHEIIVHYDPEMLRAFLKRHRGPDFAATSSSSKSSKSSSSSKSSKSSKSSSSSKSKKGRSAKKGGKRTYKRRK
jgi:hypothetical protein